MLAFRQSKKRWDTIYICDYILLIWQSMPAQSCNNALHYKLFVALLKCTGFRRTDDIILYIHSNFSVMSNHKTSYVFMTSWVHISFTTKGIQAESRMLAEKLIFLTFLSLTHWFAHALQKNAQFIPTTGEKNYFPYKFTSMVTSLKYIRWRHWYYWCRSCYTTWQHCSCQDTEWWS